MIKPIDANEDKYPDSRAVIGYENLLSSVDDNRALGTLTPNTYEGFAASVGESVGLSYEFTAGSAEIDYIAVSGTGFPQNVAVYAIPLDEFDSPIATYSGNLDAGTLFFSFDAITAHKVVFQFSAVGGETLHVMSAGMSLKMTQPIYGGHSPINLSSKTEYSSAKSVNGNFIGRTIERQGGASQFNWKNLDPYWYRENFQPFVNSAKTKPFFIKWRPDYHSEESAYCWTTQDIKPQNQGGGSQLMSVGVQAESYSGI